MKGIFGSMLFIIGIGLFIGSAHKYNYDTPWWIVMIILVAIISGLKLLISEGVDDANQALRDDLEKLRDEVEELEKR